MSKETNNPCMVDDSSGILSRTSLRGTPTSAKLTRLRRSTRLGYLFFLQQQGRLSPDQLVWLLEEQKRVKFEELERAAGLLKRLLVSPKSAARAAQEIEYTLTRIPSYVAKSKLREQRRIGVGYRDKGSLREPHEDHKAIPRSWWSEDIAPALLLPPEEPRWMTADEVGLDAERYSTIQELALRSLLAHSVSPPDFTVENTEMFSQD